MAESEPSSTPIVYKTTLLAVALSVLLTIWYLTRRGSQSAARRSVALIVLGDIGRSPRMQYHAMSFASNGFAVDFVGYDGTKPPNALLENPNIEICHISQPWRLPDNAPKVIFLLYAPFKVFAQMFLLFWTLLFRLQKPDYILVQNPPSIPTLALVRIVCWLRHTPRLVIDWHNFGYTILALRLGNTSPVVKFAKWYEQVWGGTAYAHLTVTNAMHRVLAENWKLRGTIKTLYDKPPSHFRRLSLEETHEFLGRLNLEDAILEQSIGDSSTFLPAQTTNSTLLTSKTSASVPAQYRADRPILIISSTSWTADEDFSILLEAAKRCNAEAERCREEQGACGTFPKLLFVITGKGPLRTKYMEDIAKMKMSHVRIVTLWLVAEDYPRLLGAADLGICLHTSSSGLDLPMKVVDMFGCGLPVCAVGFGCLDELVQHGKNGLVFRDSDELAKQLIDLFKNFPAGTTNLERMRQHVAEFQKQRWDVNWNNIVLPLLEDGR